MVSSILKQTAGILRKQKNSKRWQKGFWCLAIAVVVGTVAILTVTGQALTHKTKVLNCQLEVHEHTDECYDEDDNLICGYADYVVHVHNDDCYDSEGNLVCTLPEIEEHEHTDECYEEQQALICEAAEAAGTEGHVHTEECYETVETGQACDKEEHTHDDSCYEETLTCNTEEHTHDDGCRDENGELVCGKEEHTHDGSCYESKLTCDKEEHTHDDSCAGTTEKVLKCGKEESKGAAGHTHTEECYRTEKVLTCGKLELHTHEQALVEDGGCYDESAFDEETGEFIEGSLPVCGLLQLEEHTHGEECFEVVEAPEVHAHSANCYDENGNLICGFEDAEDAFQGSMTQTYEGEGFKVTAEYTAAAKIPAEAELIAEQITADNNEEHYAQREAEYRESVESESATMWALLKIGFYVDGVEIEPESPVTLTVQMLDEAGMPEGSPITVVHFGEESTEVLDGSRVENGSTTFQMESFSEVAIGYRPSKEGGMYVSQSFRYEDEALQVTFHVQGEVVAAEGEEPLPENVTDIVSDTVRPVLGDGEIPAKPEPGEEPAENKENTENTAPAESEEMETDPLVEAGEPAESEGVIEPEDGTEEAQPEEIGDELYGEAEEGTEVPSDESAEPQESAPAERLQLQVKPVSRSSEEYAAFAAYVTKTESSAEQLMLQVMKYTLFYDGIALDLTDCRVTAEFVPTQELKSYAEGNAPALASFEVKEDKEGEEVSREVTVEILQLAEDNQVTQSAMMLIGSEGVDTSITSTDEQEKSEEGKKAPADLEIAEGNTSVKPDRKEEAEKEGSETNPIVDEAPTVASEPEIRAVAPDEMVVVSLDTDIRTFAAKVEGMANPHFTVQYYANLNLVAYNDSNLKETIDNKGNTNELPVIDTTGGKLPVNGKGKTSSPTENPIMNLYVDVRTGKVKTKAELTEVYEEREFEYYKAPSMNYINAVIENPSYELTEVWVLKEGKKANSVARGDWDIYPYNEDLHFTNRELSSGDNYVYIADKATIRLVYNTVNNKTDIEAQFFDYDLGDGKIYSNQNDAKNQTNGNNTSKQGDGIWYMHTKQSGINNPKNYTGSGSKFAFGNANTGSGLQHEKWEGNLLNKFNGTQDGHPSVNGSYKGCTFGLVKSLTGGKIQYADKVNVPNLFDDGEAIGKTVYGKGEFSLKFDQVGDTHTLVAVNGAESSASGLDSFNHPKPNASTVHNHIWTNNFWPMDAALSYGTNGHDMKFGSYANRAKYKFAGMAGAGPYSGNKGNYATANGEFPWSDDGVDHNSYFGMHYRVGFDLVADYVGPLEYYFFGDDDMWVFLSDESGNGKLVCDIGGVHSSVGEYLNLWDYIDIEKEGMHRHTDECYGNGIDKEPTCGKVDSKKFTLDFYYTERGESGSTCWMQFTLPSVSVETPETTSKDYGHLEVRKDVKVMANGEEFSPSELFNGTQQGEYFENKEFTFVIKLMGPNGQLKDDYAYIKYDKNGKPIISEEGGGSNSGGILAWETIADGETFTLKDGEYIRIQYLPQGTTYTITESTESDAAEIQGVVYGSTDVTKNGELLKDKLEVTDMIPSNDTHKVAYTNKYSVYALPETGGSGPGMYIMAGAFVMLLGAGFIYRKKSRKGAA